LNAEIGRLVQENEKNACEIERKARVERENEELRVEV
jgi:hypothetical protein